MAETLRVLSIGAGAIGTYIGGSLGLHGQQVAFLERPAVAQELEQRGLRLNLAGQEHRLAQPQIFQSMQAAIAAGPYDIGLFALKSYDTPAFLASIAELKEEIPTLLCLSNGVENEPALAALLGTEKVIAGTVTSSVGRRAAGDIILERLRGVGVAEGHPLSGRLAAAFQAAGLNARLYARAIDMKWSKMLTNLIGNASAAILDMTPDEIFAHPGLYRLEIQQLREALAVMRAAGMRVEDLPGTPVRLLAFAARSLPPVIAQPLLRKAVGGGRGGKMPSFHIDLHNGRGKSEVDFLNGAVVRAAQQAGLTAPVNQLLNQTLLALTNQQIPLQTYQKQPAKFLAISG